MKTELQIDRPEPAAATSAYATTRAQAWLVVAMLLPVALLNYLDRVTITTMRQSLTADIPMSDAQFGLLMTAFLWVYGILSPVAGYLGDRIGRSRVIVASLLVWSAVTWLTTLAHSFPGLIVARALMGISEACYLPAALALIADYHRGPTRSLATGVQVMGVYLGSAMGGLGGHLAQSFGWRSSFTILGAIGVGYALALAGLLRDPPATTNATTPDASPSRVSLLSGMRSVMMQPSFAVLLTVFVIFSVVNWGMIQWLPTYLGEHFGLDQTAAGWYATALPQAGAMVGILVGGFWADRWSRTNRRARALVPLVGLSLAGPFVVCGSTTTLLPLALLGFTIYGVGKSFSDANWMPVLCQIADPRYRATGYGVMNLFSCLVGGLAPWGGGVLRDANVGLATIFQVLGVVYFAASFLFLLIRPRREVES